MAYSRRPVKILCKTDFGLNLHHIPTGLLLILQYPHASQREEGEVIIYFLFVLGALIFKSGRYF
jgi:hypothetical protein